MERLEEMLSGGHPNSLGRTVEVVSIVLADRPRLQELFECYRSNDPVVRLRTSNALKRVEAERREWLTPLIDPLIDEIGDLDQPSAQWTLAQLFLRLGGVMTVDQRRRATDVMKRNLVQYDDWIVLTATIETLARWTCDDPDLTSWLMPHLARLAADRRKSVAGRAKKISKSVR